MKQIRCADQEQFFEAVYQLTVRGLTFKADMDTLTINLLGGF